MRPILPPAGTVQLSGRLGKGTGYAMFDAEDHNGKPVEADKLYTASLREGKDWLADRKAEGFRCPECKTPVFFVSSGLSGGGNSPYFRVGTKRPHTLSSCGATIQGSQGTSKAGPTTQTPGVRNTGRVKAVRYEQLQPLFMSGTASGGGGGTTGGTGGTGAGTKYTDSGGSPGNQQTTGLRAHLRSLRNLPDYPNQDMRLDVAGRGQVYPAEYFCRFEDATDAHATPVHDGKARLMAYWGVITWPNEGNSLFLNGQGMAILLPKKTAKTFLEALGVSDPKQLTNCHVIAEGRLQLGQGGNRYIRVDDTTRMAVLPPKTP